MKLIELLSEINKIPNRKERRTARKKLAMVVRSKKLVEMNKNASIIHPKKCRFKTVVKKLFYECRFCGEIIHVI